MTASKSRPKNAMTFQVLQFSPQTCHWNWASWPTIGYWKHIIRKEHRQSVRRRSPLLLHMLSYDQLWWWCNTQGSVCMLHVPEPHLINYTVIHSMLAGVLGHCQSYWFNLTSKSKSFLFLNQNLSELSTRAKTKDQKRILFCAPNPLLK